VAEKGRPSIYSESVVYEILDRMSKGESVHAICKLDHMPDRSTVNAWKRDDLHGFSARYEAAYLERAHHWADEIVEIADNSTNDYMEKEGKDGSTYMALNPENIQRSRLRVDARKWVASKLMPRYADKPTVDEVGQAEPQQVIITVVDASKKKLDIDDGED
jgi:hypothetical protein